MPRPRLRRVTCFTSIIQLSVWIYQELKRDPRLQSSSYSVNLPATTQDGPNHQNLSETHIFNQRSESPGAPGHVHKWHSQTRLTPGAIV